MEDEVRRARCVSRELLEEGVNGVDRVLDALLLLEAGVCQGAALLRSSSTCGEMIVKARGRIRAGVERVAGQSRP